MPARRGSPRTALQRVRSRSKLDMSHPRHDNSGPSLDQDHNGQAACKTCQVLYNPRCRGCEPVALPLLNPTPSPKRRQE